LGPARTISATHSQANRIEPSGGRQKTPQNWSWHARRWRWRERAHAWDVHQRELLALSERNARLALRQRRVEVMEDTLETIRAALDTADIAGADQEQAREWLPQLRVFLRDMLVAQRQEYERLDDGSDDPGAPLAITADDLRAAQRELERRSLPPAPQLDALPGYRQGPATGPILAVCLGDDPELLLDLAALRAVRMASGLQFSRILDATRTKFVQYLNRERDFGRPVELLHLGLPASPAGVEFVDGLADGSWLSERLGGVRVLLLACCRGDSVGDWLGVVPYVVSLREDAGRAEVALLAQHFWQGIGLGQEPGAALEAALRRCPPILSEYVVRHW
jgi:hypothetical protein